VNFSFIDRRRAAAARFQARAAFCFVCTVRAGPCSSLSELQSAFRCCIVLIGVYAESQISPAIDQRVDTNNRRESKYQPAQA
jgi:hypothetical protein